jgi:hypothetical protein
MPHTIASHIGRARFSSYFRIRLATCTKFKFNFNENNYAVSKIAHDLYLLTDSGGQKISLNGRSLKRKLIFVVQLKPKHHPNFSELKKITVLV